MVFNVVSMLVIAQQAVLRIAEWASWDISNTFIGLWMQGDRGLLYISIYQPCGKRQAISLTREDR